MPDATMRPGRPPQVRGQAVRDSQQHRRACSTRSASRGVRHTDCLGRPAAVTCRTRRPRRVPPAARGRIIVDGRLVGIEHDEQVAVVRLRDAAPFMRTAIERRLESFQSASVISRPDGCSHVTSLACAPRRVPLRNVSRRSQSRDLRRSISGGRTRPARHCASQQRPVDPAQLVVLAVGIVVAALGAAEFVAGEQHRHALRQEHRSEQVARLARAQRQHGRVVGRPFDAVVRAQVVRVAVAVVLEVRLVVAARRTTPCRAA